jgi:subtilisin family serine protease
MPVRIFGSDGSPTGYSQIASAIKFAANNGADIISNSWSIRGQSNPIFSDRIVKAIEYAVTEGRNGKGCVVVFSASNSANRINGDNGIVSFPSNVDIPGVITVGASDRDDRQANYSPMSTMSSPYNQIIDVVAPSRKATSDQISSETNDVWTIDIPGHAGYNPVKNVDHDGGVLPIPGSYLPSSGTNFEDYTGHFGGTSASCPMVAGVAALILSQKPYLSQMEVFEIICTTARRVPYYNHSNDTYGMWSNELGYGVVDAYVALTQQRSCYRLYNYRTFTGYNQPIEGCEVELRNTTVKSGATVILNAPVVTINDGFTIEAGATFEIRDGN